MLLTTTGNKHALIMLQSMMTVRIITILVATYRKQLYFNISVQHSVLCKCKYTSKYSVIDTAQIIKHLGACTPM